MNTKNTKISLDLMVRWLTGQASIEEFPPEARAWAMHAAKEAAKMLEDALK